jgi:MATE family multidrug resistance protein
VFAMGLLLGLDTFVSLAYGAGKLEECHRWLHHGVLLSIALTLPITAGLWGISATLDRWGFAPVVLELTRPYLNVVTWSVLPLLLYASFRRYLQAMDAARPIVVALVLANVMNAFVNWVLIFGRLGAPAMGVEGAAWATVVSRLVMAGILLAAIVVRERGLRPGLFATPLRIELPWLVRLFRIGFPAAMQITLEVGVFAAAGVLAARVTPAALAAHQIALNIAGFTFMVPLGISAAAAVRVGQAIGRLDSEGVMRSGWTAILFGTLFMSCAAAAFLLFPRVLIGAFTTDTRVLELGVSLLAVAAVFQLFDGLQGVSTGVLRGAGDTRTPMLWNLAGHWFIGLPLGYALCFVAPFGVIGLWCGLSVGLIICGIALLLGVRSTLHSRALELRRVAG